MAIRDSTAPPQPPTSAVRGRRFLHSIRSTCRPAPLAVVAATVIIVGGLPGAAAADEDENRLSRPEIRSETVPAEPMITSEAVDLDLPVFGAPRSNDGVAPNQAGTGRWRFSRTLRALLAAVSTLQADRPTSPPPVGTDPPVVVPADPRDLVPTATTGDAPSAPSRPTVPTLSLDTDPPANPEVADPPGQPVPPVEPGELFPTNTITGFPMSTGVRPQEPRPLDETLDGDPDRPYVHVLGDEGPLLDRPPAQQQAPSVPAAPAPPAPVPNADLPPLPNVPLADGPTYDVEGLLDPRRAARSAGDEPGSGFTSVEIGASVRTRPDGPTKDGVSASGRISTTVNRDGSVDVTTSQTTSNTTTSGIDLGIVGVKTTNSASTGEATSYRLSPDTHEAVEAGADLPTYDPYSLGVGDSITTMRSTDGAVSTSGTVGRRFGSVGLEAGITTGSASGNFDSQTVSRTDHDTVTVFRSSGTSSSTEASVSGNAGAGKSASGGLRDRNKVSTNDYTGLRVGYDVGPADDPHEGELDDYVADLSGQGPQLDPRDNFQTVRGETTTIESSLDGGARLTAGPAGTSVRSGEVYWRDSTRIEHHVTHQSASGRIDDATPMDAGSTVSRSSTGGQFVHAGVDYPDIDVKVTNTVDPSGFFEENVRIRIGNTETRYTNESLKDAARNLAVNDPNAADNPVVQSILNDNSMTGAFAGRGDQPGPTPTEIADAVDSLAAQGPTGTYDEAPVLAAEQARADAEDASGTPFGGSSSSDSDSSGPSGPSSRHGSSSGSAAGNTSSSSHSGSSGSGGSSHGYDDAPSDYSGATSTGPATSGYSGSTYDDAPSDYSGATSAGPATSGYSGSTYDDWTVG